MCCLTEPLSLYAIPAMWVITYYPVFTRGRTIKKFQAWNNVAPRSNVASLAENKDIPPEVAARVARMEGAHNNGLENLGFFGLAVLAGNFAGLDNKTLNIASGLYLIWRVVYNYVYINQRNQGTAGFRSLTWATSLIFPFYLFIQAGLAIGKRGP